MQKSQLTTSSRAPALPNLPAELQLLIFEHCLFGTKAYEGNPHYRESNILLLCKEIFRTLSPKWYQSRLFSFPNPNRMVNVFFDNATGTCLSNITHLSLRMDWLLTLRHQRQHDIFDMFISSISTYLHLPKLQLLELRYTVPDGLFRIYAHAFEWLALKTRASERWWYACHKLHAYEQPRISPLEFVEFCFCGLPEWDVVSSFVIDFRDMAPAAAAAADTEVSIQVHETGELPDVAGLGKACRITAVFSLTRKVRMAT